MVQAFINAINGHHRDHSLSVIVLNSGECVMTSSNSGEWVLMSGISGEYVNDVK